MPRSWNRAAEHQDLAFANEFAAISPTPASITWRRASDVRGFAAAGYALLLQVAHPTVGAGVKQHSNYATDPWGRLVRTLDYVTVLVYGGPEAAAQAGAKLREGHAKIRGVDASGHRYSALEPGAFAWVHATLAEAIVRVHAHFGRPMDDEQTDRFYREFRALGAFHGLRPSDLPDSWEGFRAYFDDIVATRLERTEAVDDLLRTITRPRRPAAWMPRRAWRVARRPLTETLELTARGLLPPVLRERFGLTWSERDARRFERLGRASRAMTPLLPSALLTNGPYYLRLRQHALLGASHG